MATAPADHHHDLKPLTPHPNLPSPEHSCREPGPDASAGWLGEGGQAKLASFDFFFLFSEASASGILDLRTRGCALAA